KDKRQGSSGHTAYKSCLEEPLILILGQAPRETIMYRRTLIGFVFCLLLAGCARMTAQRLTSERLAATDRLYASFEFDRIHLAVTLHAALTAEGVAVAPSQAAAELLLTGMYSARYEERHYRFDWAELKLVRQKTGQV